MQNRKENILHNSKTDLHRESGSKLGLKLTSNDPLCNGFTCTQNHTDAYLGIGWCYTIIKETIDAESQGQYFAWSQDRFALRIRRQTGSKAYIK